jgi:DNA-binding MarR family transcriptional regulator
MSSGVIMSNTGKMKRLEEIISDMVILRGLYRGFTRSNSIPEGRSLTSPRFLVLGLLIKEGPRPMSELSHRSQLSKQHLTAIADGLVNDGLAIRQPFEGDRRIINMSVTQEGKEMFSRSKDLALEALAEKLGRLDDEDIDVLHRSLEDLKRVLVKLED